MLIGVVRHVRDAAHILTDELAQDAIALAMEDADTRHSHEDGIVDEVLHGIESFVATHTTYIEILMEIALVGIDGLAGLLADAVGGEALLALLGLVLLGALGGVLQSVEAHLGAHTPEHGGRHVARDALYLAHGGEALDAHGVASLQLTVVVGLRLILCIAESGCGFLLVLCLFRLALGMAFLALLYLSYLASYLVIVLLGVYLLHLLLEGIELLADALGLLLLRLILTDLSDGVLYLLVALLQEFLGLLLRLGENLLATLLDLLDVALILGDVFSISFSR